MPRCLADVASPVRPAGSLVITKGFEMVPDTYEVLRRNLSGARRMLARGYLSLWLLRATTLVATTLFLSTALVLLVGTDSPATAVLGVLVVFGLPVLVLYAVVAPLLRIPTVERVAVMADRLEGEKNTLISSLQLGRRIDELSFFYSKAIIQAIVGEGEALSRTVDFRRLLPAKKLRSWSVASILATLALVAFLAFVPGAYEPSFSSIVSHPFEERVTVSVKPGDIEIEPGETVRVRVTVKGSLSEPKLRVKPGSGPWNYVTLVRASEPAGVVEASVFEVAIDNIEMSTQYAAELPKTQTPVYTISVRTPTEVSEFLIAYEFPAYAGVEKRVVRSVVGDVSALRGTRVWLETVFSG